MQLKYRRIRDDAYAEGQRSFDQLSEAPTFRDFVVLYMAEGYKHSPNRVSICNSDPLAVGSRTAGNAAAGGGAAGTACSSSVRMTRCSEPSYRHGWIE